MCVHGEKECVYVHVHAWVKDFIYWLISMCVCLCTCAWLHDTLYVLVNKYITNTPLPMHIYTVHTCVSHSQFLHTSSAHTYNGGDE